MPPSERRSSNRGSRGDGAGATGPGPDAAGFREVVVLVPTVDVKAAARKTLPDSVTVLTALESKGLEYKVVLLYNFFSASRLKPEKWRLFYHVLAARQLIPEEAIAPGGKFACPHFDSQAHALLAPELKALYVAITRGREDVVFLEEDERACGPALELWDRMGLVELRSEADAGVLSRLQRQISSDELRRRAQELYRSKLYEDAALLFARLGDEVARQRCQAQVARASAVKASNAGNSTLARQRYGEAGRLFESSGALLQAAQCYEAAELWREAGGAYVLCGPSNELKAAECFERAKLWRDAAELLVRVLPRGPTPAILERVGNACSKAAEYELGIAAMDRLCASLGPSAYSAAPSGTAASGRGAGDTAGRPAASSAGTSPVASGLDQMALRLRRRLVSLGAVRWKDRAGGEERMMAFVRMMPGREEQRRWLNRYHLYDILLQMDIEEGRFLDAGRTCEQRGDVDRAVELYDRSNRRDMAAQLLLRRARAAVLWTGTSHHQQHGDDWPPRQGAGGKWLKRLTELLSSPPVAASGSRSEARAAALTRYGADGVAASLAACQLELEVMQFLTGAAGKAASIPTTGVCHGSGDDGGSSNTGLLAVWSVWRDRLEGSLAPETGAVVMAPRTRVPTRTAAFMRLCVLRLLCGEAIRSAKILQEKGQRSQQKQQLKVSQLHQVRLGAASACGQAALSAAVPDLGTVSAAAVELLRLWGLYRRLLTDVRRVFVRHAAVAGPGREAALLGAVQDYHVVLPAANAASDDGAGGLSSDTTPGLTRGSNMLFLGVPPSAAWVRSAREKLGIKFGGGVAGAATSDSTAAAPVEISREDFVKAAALYWQAEMLSRSRAALQALVGLAAVLQPEYEEFKQMGAASAAVEVRDPIRRSAAHDGILANRGGAATVPAEGMDATQLRAQLLAAAVQESRLLVQMAEDKRSNDHAATLHTCLNQVYETIVAPSLPAMEQAGSLPAARAAAADALELYAANLLAAVAARPPGRVLKLQNSQQGLMWERPRHTRLSLEEILQFTLLQPLLPEGWLLRMERERHVDWEVPWNSLPVELSAWQVLLESARVADYVRPQVQAGSERRDGRSPHVVLSIARFGMRALLDTYRGISLTPKPREWEPWIAVRPLTFLALMERYALLALAVLTRGANGLVLPSSLLLDHASQPGIADLLSYTIRNTHLAYASGLAELRGLLAESCRVLGELLRQPQCVYPAGALHAPCTPSQQAVPGSSAWMPSSSQPPDSVSSREFPDLAATQYRRTRLNASTEIPSGGPTQDKQEEQQLGMFVHRAIVLLFTIKLNLGPEAPSPAGPAAAGRDSRQAGTLRPLGTPNTGAAGWSAHLGAPSQQLRPQQRPPVPLPNPTDVCLHVIKASGMQETATAVSKPLARQSGGASHVGQGQRSTSVGTYGGLATVMPLLPCTVRLMLNSLRARIFGVGRLHDSVQLHELMGSEFGRIMYRGQDRVLRLFRRSVRRVSAPGAEWTAHQKSFNIEAWHDVKLSQAGTRSVAFFQMPPALLNAGASNLAAEDETEDQVEERQPDGEDAAAAQHDTDADAVAAREAEASGRLAAEDLLSMYTASGSGTTVDDSGMAAVTAAANSLGRYCFVAARLWLSRARQARLLPTLEPLPAARRAARALFHSLAARTLDDDKGSQSVGPAGAFAAASPEAQGYVAMFLEHACPLQVQAAEVLRRLHLAVRELQQPWKPSAGSAAQPDDKAQMLDTVLEFRDELEARSSALLDVSRNTEHKRLDVVWLKEAVAGVQQLLEDIKLELDQQHKLLT